MSDASRAAAAPDGQRPRRPTKDELLAAAGKTVPDLIKPDLTVLFVGINPGLYTAAIGHHFGRPGNRFWPALFESGFTPRLLTPCEEAELLSYGLGLTNLVARATRAASELAADAVRTTLEDPEFGFTGLHAAAAVADTLGTGDTVLLGASNPVRDASWVGLPFDGVDTYAPRGAAGIDGSVSQAVGVALATQAAHPDEPRAPRTVALLGDVTFLHDVGGLLIGPNEPHPENLTIVVANDDGGGIFETLEIGAEPLRASFERAFGTPHGASICELCAGYGVAHREVTSLRELLDALMDTTEAPLGLSVIEARTTRTTRRALHRALQGKIAL